MLLRDRLLRVLPVIEQLYPRCRWIFLTLTVCGYSSNELCSNELSSTLKLMCMGWQRLVKRSKFHRVVLGWVRTISFKRYDGVICPYYQALLLVSSGYFGERYVSNWAELWRECARLDYTPIVDTRVVVDCCEFIKTMEYPVSCEELKDGDWVMELSKQVSSNRLTATGGLLRRLLRK